MIISALAVMWRWFRQEVWRVWVTWRKADVIRHTKWKNSEPAARGQTCMHEHNLTALLATRKWRVVSSHWLDADKAPDCTCRKSIDSIRIRASFLTNSSGGELSVCISLQTQDDQWKTCRETHPHKHRHPVEWWIHFPSTSRFLLLHAVRVIEDQDTGALDLERAAAASLQEGSAPGFERLPAHLEQSGNSQDAEWNKSHTLRCSSKSCCESKCQQMLKISCRWTTWWCSMFLCLPACALARSRMWEETESPPGGAALFFKLFTATRGRL